MFNDIKNTHNVTLDFTASAELSFEGIYNELTHAINSLRKKANLSISEFTNCTLATSDGFVRHVVDLFNGDLKAECLLKDVTIVEGSKDTMIKIKDAEQLIPFRKMHSSVGVKDGRIDYRGNDFPTYWHALEATAGKPNAKA